MKRKIIVIMSILMLAIISVVLLKNNISSETSGIKVVTSDLNSINHDEAPKNSNDTGDSEAQIKDSETSKEIEAKKEKIEKVDYSKVTFTAKLGNKEGIINGFGEWIIEPKYMYMSTFIDGLALVDISNYESGFIDRSGEMVLGPYSECSSFFDGLAACTGDNGKKGYINQKGEWVIEPKFNEAFSFHNERAFVSLDKKWLYGIIDTKGDWIVEPKFSFAVNFSEGLACVLFDGEDEKPVIIDTNGNVVLESYIGRYMGEYHEGLYVNQKPNGLYGYFDKTGKWIIEAQFHDANDFENGRAVIMKDGKYGVINKKGELIVSLEVDEVKYHYDDKLYVKRNNKYGILDTDGKTIVNCKYEDISVIRDGLVSVKIEGKWGIIDLNENIIVEPTFDEIS